MTIGSDEDLEKMKEIGAICRSVLAAMRARVCEGITPLELDDIAGRMLSAAGARSAPQLAYDFPGHACISVGTAVAHGIPDDRPLRAGEMVNIDVSAEKDGYFADTGASMCVGAPCREVAALLKATEDTQRRAMYTARAGRPISGVARIVEARAKQHGYHIVEGLNGHGVGRWIHEEPRVSNTLSLAQKGRLKRGQVITVEPFLATRSRSYVEDADGWTLRLQDGGLGAQFEHTFVVTDGAPIVLT